MNKLYIGAGIIAASGAGAIYFMGRGQRPIEEVAVTTAIFTGGAFVLAKKMKVI